VQSDESNLEERDFEDAKEWLHPSITEVINKDPTEQDIIPVQDTNEHIKTSKLILIPIFPVTLIMNKGQPTATMDTFHQFYGTFWEQVPP